MKKLGEELSGCCGQTLGGGVRKKIRDENVSNNLFSEGTTRL